MRKLLSLLLCLFLLPTAACADQEKTFGLSYAELDVLHARYDELLENTIPDLPYPDCCEGMTGKDRLLYVALTYESYLRSSGGLCSFLLEEPEVYTDLSQALIMTGNAEHASLLMLFTREIDTDGASLFHLAGSLHRNLAYALHDFAAFDAKIEQEGYGQTLAQRLVRFIASEPLWRAEFETWLTLVENIALDVTARVTDAPWPACADALNENERALYLCYNFLINWECGGLCGFLINTEYTMLSPTLDALERIAPHSGHRDIITAFGNESGLSLTDAAALESFRRFGLIDYQRAAIRYPFEPYDDELMAAELTFSLRDTMAAFISQHPDSFR